MRRLRPLFCALLIAAAASACGGMPTRGQASPEVQAAERLYAEGDFPAAAAAFLDAARGSRSARASLTLRAAEAWREDGRIEQARPLLAEINTRRMTADELLRVNLLGAELALIDRDPQRALDLLAAPVEAAPERQRDRIHFLRAQAHAGLDQPFEAARERAALAAYLPAGEQAENDQAISALLSQLKPADLQRSASRLDRGDPAWDRVAAQLRSLGLAMPSPSGVVNTGSGSLRPRSIALLLPRSGALAAAGEAVRDGFMAAYYADASEDRPRVRVYDAGDSVEQNLEAYRNAAADGAERVVGPLSREAVTALFEMGTPQVPMLALNRAAVTPPPGSQSFALSPEDEGIAAAERLLALGYRRVVVVNGGDEHARRVLAALAPTFARGGGSVVTEIQPPVGSPDYSGEIQRAIAAAGTRALEVVPETPDRSGAVHVDADAFYMALRFDQARLFVPQLRAAGVFDRPLLASSQIISSAGAAIDRDFNGIEFSELPWLLGIDIAGVPSTEDSRRLGSAQGASARLFAFGIDAYRVLAALPALLRMPGTAIEGATGALSLDDFGQVQRQPAWGRFHNGRVRPAPAPEGLLPLNDAGAALR
jgi:outer membrane PBP1 activator LpoA protein